MHRNTLSHKSHNRTKIYTMSDSVFPDSVSPCKHCGPFDVSNTESIVISLHFLLSSVLDSLFLLDTDLFYAFPCFSDFERKLVMYTN